jgi:hypothetical protein
MRMEEELGDLAGNRDTDKAIAIAKWSKRAYEYAMADLKKKNAVAGQFAASQKQAEQGSWTSKPGGGLESRSWTDRSTTRMIPAGPQRRGTLNRSASCDELLSLIASDRQVSSSGYRPSHHLLKETWTPKLQDCPDRTRTASTRFSALLRRMKNLIRGAAQHRTSPKITSMDSRMHYNDANHIDMF